MSALKEELGSDYVQSLERGLAVIRCFSGETPALTLSEVAVATGLTRATARRLLLTLEALGYVRSEDRRFSLTAQALSLGYAYLSSLGIGELAQQPMQGLVERVHESCSVAVLNGMEIVYVARVPTKRLMTVSLSVGSRLPAYPASMGRVLLAGLSEEHLEQYLAEAKLEPLTPYTIIDKDRLREIVTQVRQQGWALVDQEFELGIRSVAAPIRNRVGETVAALNVSTHAGRVSPADLRRKVLPLVKETADQISDLLAHR